MYLKTIATLEDLKAEANKRYDAVFVFDETNVDGQDYVCLTRLYWDESAMLFLIDDLQCGTISKNEEDFLRTDVGQAMEGGRLFLLMGGTDQGTNKI